jgi:hypothetical protein
MISIRLTFYLWWYIYLQRSCEDSHMVIRLRRGDHKVNRWPCDFSPHFPLPVTTKSQTVGINNATSTCKAEVVSPQSATMTTAYLSLRREVRGLLPAGMPSGMMSPEGGCYGQDSKDTQVVVLEFGGGDGSDKCTKGGDESIRSTKVYIVPSTGPRVNYSLRAFFPICLGRTLVSVKIKEFD